MMIWSRTLNKVQWYHQTVGKRCRDYNLDFRPRVSCPDHRDFGWEIPLSIMKNSSFRHTNVTKSAKTGHNRAGLNLQHKALNTSGAYLCIVKKNCKFFERFFLSERMG